MKERASDGLNESKQDMNANRTRGETRTTATSIRYINERKPERDKYRTKVKDRQSQRGGERDGAGERRGWEGQRTNRGR